MLFPSSSSTNCMRPAQRLMPAANINAIRLKGQASHSAPANDLTGVYAGMADHGEDAPAYRSPTPTVMTIAGAWSLPNANFAIIPQLHNRSSRKNPRQLPGRRAPTSRSPATSLLPPTIAASDFPAGARANGTPPSNYWMYHCGPQWAKRLLFRATSSSPPIAARIGLVMELLQSPTKLDAEANRSHSA